MSGGTASDAAIRATYLLETALDVDAAVEVLAGEASTGTFVPVPGEDPALRERFGMRLERATPVEAEVRRPLAGPAATGGTTRAALVTVALPFALTGPDLVTVLASVAGNVTELREVTALRLVDLELPPAVVAASPRPALSVAGVRRLTGVPGRPLRAAQAPMDGADLVLERELAPDPPGRPLEERLAAARRGLGDGDGDGPVVAFAITDSAAAMARHAERVERAGGQAVQVALAWAGLPAVASLRRRTGLCIVGRPTGFGVHGRAEASGIAFRAWQKLWRLAGVDVLPVPAGAAPDAAADCLAPIRDDGDRALPLVAAGAEAGAGPDCAVLAPAAEAVR